jgi:transposase
MRVAVSVELTDEERTRLEGWSRGRRTPVRLAQRARIILLAAEGRQNKEIAQEVGVSRQLVARWRQRFAGEGLSGIEKDAPRGGRKPRVRDRVAEKILKTTTQEKPPHPQTHWSVRTLAETLGVSRSMVHRVWTAHEIKPHLTRTFKVSNDPQFVEKVMDVVGLYLDPPEHALVLCADEKSQIQALDRTQPSLPMVPGRCGTLTHDYRRHGTTTLFAALELAEGRVIGTCMQRHRHQEWIKFLTLIDQETPPDLDLHLIVDNYRTHKHDQVQRWLKRHPRFHMHFIPTSSSWLNLVERWFRELSEKCLKRGAFQSVHDLIDVLHAFLDTHNENPSTFTWSAKSEDIIAKYRRAKAVLDKSQTA